MNQKFLKTVLLLDAAVTGVNALAYLLLPSFIKEHLGYSLELQLGAGIFLAVFVVFVLLTALRQNISEGSVKAIIGVNLLWPIVSLVALIAGWLTATTLGAVWAVLQALVVAAFALLQTRGLKQAS